MVNVESEEKLRDYMRFAGILLCNVNPFLPSLSDVGGGWNEVVSLIEKREIFYSKAYRNRVTYLSEEAYFLLKQCRQGGKSPEGNGLAICRFLRQNGPADTETLKTALYFEKKEFTKAFDRLLADLQVTVVQNGVALTENWSTLIWGMAEEWERTARQSSAGQGGLSPEQAEMRLRGLLSRTMPVREIDRLIGRAQQH